MAATNLSHNIFAPVLDIADKARVADLAFGSVASAAAQTAALPEAVYRVEFLVAGYLKVAATASDVTASTGMPMAATTPVYVIVPANHKIGAIATSAASTSATIMPVA